MKEVVLTAAVGCELKRHATCAGRGTTEHDVSWVSTKLGDVLVHPCERHALILQAVIEAGALFDLGGGEEAVGADSIVD